MKAKRTLFLNHVDEHICQQNKAALIEHLQRRNSFLNVADLYVFSNSSTVKLTCETVAMVNKIKDSGSFIFNFFIPPRNIALEKYIPLTMCYKCYSYCDHLSSACPKPKEFRICSLYSKTDHTYKQGTSTEKLCINCGRPYSTLDLSCPHRKKIIQEKRTVTSRQSYSSTTKSGTHHNNTD